VTSESTSTRKRGFHASPRGRGAEHVAVALGSGLVLTIAIIVIVLGLLPARPAPGDASPVTGGSGRAHSVLAARTRQPPLSVSVLASAPPDVLTTEFARRLFVSAPVVVVAGAGETTLAAAETLARRAHAPLLLAAATSPAARLRGAAADGRYQ
jgi:NADPH-dependent 2,4-dienoyl-CoA reductase/sulfur reductase-like enzyme